MSHVRFLPDYGALRSARIPVGAANLVLGCDPIVAASPDSIAMMAPQGAVAVINHFVAPTNAFALDPNFRVLVTSGLTDLQLPYFGTKLLLDQIPDYGARGRLTFKVYAGGHMHYLRDDSRKLLRTDARTLIAGG